MNSVQQIKLTQFRANQKETVSSVARHISALNNLLGAAIEHQSYAHKNPDGIIDPEFLSLMGVGVDQLLAQFAEVAEKRDDLLSVKDGTMSVEDLIAKYSIDLVKYSNELV